MFTTGEFNYVLKISFKPFRQLFIQHHRKSVKCNLTRHLLSLLGPIPFVLNPRTESGPPRKNLRKQKTSKINLINLIFFINHNQSRTHSRPEVPRSFWSAPRMATSDRPNFLSMRRVFVSYSQPIRFDRIEVKSVNRGLPMLDPPRSRDSDQKRVWPLGTKMSRTLSHRLLLGMLHSFPDRCSRGTKTLCYEGII